MRDMEDVDVMDYTREEASVLLLTKAYVDLTNCIGIRAAKPTKDP